MISCQRKTNVKKLMYDFIFYAHNDFIGMFTINQTYY